MLLELQEYFEKYYKRDESIFSKIFGGSRNADVTKQVEIPYLCNSFSEEAWDRIKDLLDQGIVVKRCVDANVFSKIQEEYNGMDDDDPEEVASGNLIDEMGTLIFLLSMRTKKFIYKDINDYSFYHTKGFFFSLKTYLDYTEDDKSKLQWHCDASKIDYKDIPDTNIIDLDMEPNRYKNELIKTVKQSIGSAGRSFEDYEDKIAYDPGRYTIIKEIEKEVLSDDVYDQSMSVTKEEGTTIRKWQKEHLEKYHSGKMQCRGCTPVSYFEIHMGWTGLGDYVDCVCNECKRLDPKGERKKEYIYYAREIG